MDCEALHQRRKGHAKEFRSERVQNCRTRLVVLTCTCLLYVVQPFAIGMSLIWSWSSRTIRQLIELGIVKRMHILSQNTPRIATVPFQMIVDLPLPRLLAIYLIKRSRVRVAAIPDFIDGFCGLHIVSTIGPTSDGQSSSASHTLLVLLGKLPLASGKELPGPPALPT